MAISFGIKPGTSKSTTTPPTHEDTYVLAGVYDDLTAKVLANSSIPKVVFAAEGLLYLQDLQVMHKGHGIYEIQAPYAQNKRETGELSFRFSTTGGSVHIKHSRSTVQSYPRVPFTAPDFKQGIGARKTANGHEMDGTDIIIPALKLSYTFRHPAGVVNEAFARNVAGATGRVNDTTFRGFEAGEVLMLGADGSDGTNAVAEVSYHFAAEKNLTGLIIGAITGIAKQGHDLLWVYWCDTTDSNSNPVAIPQAVYVERLYERINFAATLGWGG